MTGDRRFTIVLAAVMLAAAAGCGGGTEEEGTMPTRDIDAVLGDHAPGLVAIEGVNIVAVGETADGVPCIAVYVAERSDGILRQLPETLEGHPVEIRISGEVEPLGND